MSTLLDMYGVDIALSISKPDESNTSAKQLKIRLMQIRYADTPYLVPCLMIYLMCIAHIKKQKKFEIH